MQIGEFIRDRWMVKMIRDIAEEKNLAMKSFSDDWIHELRLGSATHRIIGYRFDVNDVVSSAISQDKVATYEILQSRSIPAVPHVILRHPLNDKICEALDTFGDIVVKPLQGTSGHGVKRCATSSEVKKYIVSQPHHAWAASPFIDIHREIRIIMLEGEVLLSYEKSSVVIDSLKMFNLGLGATATTITPAKSLLELAKSAQSALGLRLSTVDIIESNNGEYLVLESNDSIMTEHFARQSDEYYALAKQAHRRVIERMFA